MINQSYNFTRLDGEGNPLIHLMQIGFTFESEEMKQKVEDEMLEYLNDMFLQICKKYFPESYKKRIDFINQSMNN